MKINHFALAAAGAAVCLAGAAHAEDFTPKAAGTVMLNVRITDVDPTGSDPISTTAGAATGLNAKVSDTFIPSVGLSYFFTDNLAVEVIATTTKHTVKAQGGATNGEAPGMARGGCGLVCWGWGNRKKPEIVVTGFWGGGRVGR